MRRKIRVYYIFYKHKKINSSEISTGEQYQKIVEHPFFPLEKKVIPQKIPLFDCFVAPCIYACPINQNVPQYLRFIEKKEYDNAFKIIYSKNPLPFITSIICTHFCMYNCTRRFYDNAVNIRKQKYVATKKGYIAIKNYIAAEKRNIIKNNKKVAIIGGGPAGLSSASFLARAGFEVTVFEKDENIGGIVSTTIPRFRIKKSQINKDIDLLKILDVKFVNKKINELTELKGEGFDYIIVAIGAEISKELKLEYNEGNLLDSISFLKDFNKKKRVKLGKYVVVVGGGNSAMDAARAAIRVKGVKNVTVVYRRTENEMPADREEYENACNDCISFRMLRQPVSYKNKTLTCEIMKLTDYDKDGRKKSEPTGKYELLKADSLIVAIGEEADLNWFVNNKLKIDKIGNKKDECFEIEENIFIAGDCKNGPSSVVEAIADAKKIANIICKRNNIKQDIFSKFIPLDDQKIIDEKCFFERGQLKKEIKEDYKRCLACNLYCGRCVDVCPNRANRSIAFSNEQISNYYQIIHLDYLCNECGNCETFCPYEGYPYKDKFTIFARVEDFEKSKNPGIYFEKKEKNFVLYLRDRNMQLKKGNFKNTEEFCNIFEKSIESEFSLFLINNYPEIFKNNYHFDIYNI